MYESAQMAVSLPTWSGIKVVRPGLTHVLVGLEMLKECGSGRVVRMACLEIGSR